MLKSNFKKQEEQDQDQENEISDNGYESDISDNSNLVGSSKTRKFLNLVAIVAIFGIVFYFIFFTSEEQEISEYDIETDGSILDQEIESSPPKDEDNIEILDDLSLEQPSDVVLEKPILPELPELPDLPDLSDAPEKDVYITDSDKRPFQEDDPKVIKTPLNLEPKTDQEIPPDTRENTSIIADPRKTPIMKNKIQLSPGSSVGYKGSIVDLTGNAIQEPITETPKTPIETKDLSKIIAQGKMMTAILETAINTEVPGDIRGIVNRDVYAEAGNHILIPKGTRLFGSYSSTIARGQGRVEITWSRIIRPDGLDVSISLKASDQYGRSGIAGDVDNQYSSTIANALLTSVLTVGGAMAADAIIDKDASTTTGSDGSVISTASASAQVVTDVTGAIVDTVKEMITDSINIQPTIRIPHGTKMTVIVSSDITLPPYEY